MKNAINAFNKKKNSIVLRMGLNIKRYEKLKIVIIIKTANVRYSYLYIRNYHGTV